MINDIKCTIIALVTCLLGSTAVAQQADLNLNNLAVLQKAYEHVLAQEYDDAERLYKGLQSEKDVKADIKRAAVEGQNLVALLELNVRIEEAKGDKVKARLLRFPRRTTISQLKKASAQTPSDALLYMYALVKEDEEVSEKTFTDMRFAKEYERLEGKQIKVATAPKTISVPKATTAALVNGVKITGATAANVRNVKYIANNIVNVRSGPGKGYSQVKSVSSQQEVTVVQSIRLSDGEVWYKIKKGNQIGYVAARFFTKVVRKNTPAKKQPNVKITSGSGACSGKSVSVYITKRNAAVKHRPNGKSVIFTYVRQTTVKVYGTVAGHVIVRLTSNGKFTCGYIKR